MLPKKPPSCLDNSVFKTKVRGQVDLLSMKNGFRLWLYIGRLLQLHNTPHACAVDMAHKCTVNMLLLYNSSPSGSEVVCNSNKIASVESLCPRILGLVSACASWQLHTHHAGTSSG